LNNGIVVTGISSSCRVPMLLRYDQKQGVSKMNVGRTTRQTLKLLAKRRLGR
jgi:dolichol-phosphate mannosyltransferase